MCLVNSERPNKIMHCVIHCVQAASLDIKLEGVKMFQEKCWYQYKNFIRKPHAILVISKILIQVPGA